MLVEDHQYFILYLVIFSFSIISVLHKFLFYISAFME